MKSHLQTAGTVTVSARHPRYFATAAGDAAGAGQTFIPIGLNLCFPRFARDEKTGLKQYEIWLDALARNGGNFARVWLGHPFFNVEPVRAGAFDEAIARRLDAVLAMAQERGIRLKLTLEHFRSIQLRTEAELFAGAASFARPVYSSGQGGYALSMRDFLDSPQCRLRYTEKLHWLAGRYAGHPAVFGWELWNEMDAVDAPEQSWLGWSADMLATLRRRMPEKLLMQSLGSYDSEVITPRYAAYARLPQADLVQVHRYLDPGADFAYCQGPMDVLCAQAVETLRQMAPQKPVLLAECGAVESRHSAPSRLYEKDTLGILLHDQLFAPFFAGAAGSGQAWHWDFYVERHNLWHHFAAFAQALEGFDPVAQAAEPRYWEADGLRIYALRGKNTSLLWLRDARSDWRTELISERVPELRRALTLMLPEHALACPQQADCFDPWTGAHGQCSVDGHAVTLDSFQRSAVLRIVHQP